MNVMEIMRETCWGSLSYCCSLEKNCPKRDEVMKLLKMSRVEYRQLKEDFDKSVEKTREN